MLARKKKFISLGTSIEVQYLVLQLVELKEAKEKSLKESERIQKEIAEVQEMKVNIALVLSNSSPICQMFLSSFWFVRQINRKRSVP